MAAPPILSCLIALAKSSRLTQLPLAALIKTAPNFILSNCAFAIMLWVAASSGTCREMTSEWLRRCSIVTWLAFPNGSLVTTS